MQDYIYYIDQKSLDLANVAFEVNDFALSATHYSKALEKLRRYNGDRMHPAFLAASISEKLEIIRKESKHKNSVLKFETWKLSKSTFLKGFQCHKYLYLNKHEKKEKTPPSEAQKALFKRGHIFEDKFRKNSFPNNTNIKERLGMNFGYFSSYTTHKLNNLDKVTLFEGTIIEDDVLIMVDVIDKINNDTYDFYEIKLNSELNDVILKDLTLQYYVCKRRFGNKINKFNVVLSDDKSEWKIQDLKKELESRINKIDDEIADQKKILTLIEAPKIETGKQCTRPYTCEFIDYCHHKRKGWFEENDNALL